ncbi:MAG: beta-galactosidase [Bacteroidaceae bacterium]|nr:beta-galactosidase [Bacteroidaceae bacterium]
MRLIQNTILTISFLFISLTASAQYPFGSKVTWDKHSLSIDNKRVCPVMGEVHYSRIPENEWEAEVKKMKEGGVTIIATYVFWNHVEEQEGVFDWSGQRNLRRFIEVCKAEAMPVVLRVGPFCHGEVRLGGIPDWMFTKKGSDGKALRMRSEDPVFLSFVERLYRQIFTQIQGLQWKDNGPVMACQFDNEYRGRGSYLMALKRIALGIGYDLPFYTRTGWPELATPVPFGEMIPLYGDYADGFWERSIEETAGSYWKAFHFKGQRTTDAIASEQIDYSNSKANANELQYPYFTCELGGGMMTSYHRRVYLYPEDAYSMALVKLGSGSNLLGYYMYHGGTNPVSWAERLGKSEAEGKYLNEMQRTLATNYNDLPVKTYDFQAPLGEFGQRNPHFYSLRPLHLFMQDFGDLLAPMEAVFPCADKEQKKGDNSYLRWSYRANRQGDDSCPAFVFLNNYERLQHLSAKKNVQFDVCGVKFPKKPITIPAGAMAILPVNIDIDDTHIYYATAQLVAYRDGNIYLMQIPGIPTEISVNGKVMKKLKAQDTPKAFYKNIYLLTPEQAGLLFSEQTAYEDIAFKASFTKVKESGAPRTITIGVNKAAEEPTDADFEQAAVYRIEVPEEAGQKFHRLLSIDYRGDVARLYANGQLIQDNFYNGRPLLFGLWRLPAGTTQLELRILPLQKDMPVYFPREADTTPGETINQINIVPCP